MDIDKNFLYLYGLTRLGIKASLDNITRLCDLLGRPMEEYPVIHVGGTNGKGTTSAMLQKILMESGYKCGLYTSPHLESFGERIRINNLLLSDEEASEMVEKLKPLFEKTESTFFESATAMAFLHFARKEVDVAVVEVGLGGTWDATSIVNPKMCVFTPISLDHTDRLGNTVQEIARDKAGIIKPGATTVSSLQAPEALDELTRRAELMNAPFHYSPAEFRIVKGEILLEGSKIRAVSEIYPDLSGEYEFPQPGRHQWTNLVTVLSAAGALRELGYDISADSVKRGILETVWPGRLELLRKSPLMYYDVAHNPAAAKVVGEYFREVLGGKKVRVIMGIMSDKDAKGVLINLQTAAKDFTFVEVPTERGLEPELLAIEAVGIGGSARVIRSPEDAISRVLEEAGPNEVILIVGSHYLGDAAYLFADNGRLRDRRGYDTVPIL